MNCPKQKYPLYLHRLLVLLVVALVSLPCPAKRELKLIMDIPVSQTEQNKPGDDQLSNCSTYTAISQELQVDRIDLHVGAGLLLQSTFAATSFARINQTSESFQAFSLTTKLPLFILHEQYRL